MNATEAAHGKQTGMKILRPRLVAGLGLLLATTGPAWATTVTFQEGVGGYTGTQDTFLQQNPANINTNNGASVAVGWDGDDPSGTGNDVYTLVRFDSIFGNGVGQVPLGAQITEATLSLTISDVGDDGYVHPLLVAWTEASTFSSFCGGSCDEGVEHGAVANTVPSGALATATINVTGSVQAWSDGTANHGWMIRPAPEDGVGGVDVRSSEYSVSSERPRLVIRYNEGPPPVGSLVRQPYLQMGTSNSMVVCWRSDVASDSRVQYGTVQGTLNLTATNATVSADHCVSIGSLSSATRYYYNVGSTAGVQGGGTAQHYFETAPSVGSATAFTLWAVGDGGTGTAAQTTVMNAMLTANGGVSPDVTTYLGDIAYQGGTDAEFTSNYFTPYTSVLRNTVVWPTLGNHEGASTTSGQPGASSGPYYSAFVLPMAGEAGGTASGTEAYYSFDYANVHFVCLNSYQVSRSASGPMATWLTADLAATTQDWVVAFFHHPPYSKGTHNSDTESELIEMRQNILPILEAGGVDLVLCGHSHNYERSYLIDGTYSTPTPSFATLEATGKILDDGNGRLAGDGAYQKSAGMNAHDGAVYVVAGHGGQSTGGSGIHPVMFFTERALGSCLLDFNGNSVTLRNIRSDGQVTDNFTIQKGDPPPKVTVTNPPKAAVLASLASIQVTFNQAVTGVNAADLNVNGSNATSMSGTGAGPYTFSGFTAPGDGVKNVTMLPGGIASQANPLLVFAGDSWFYTVDTTPPHLANELPARGTTVAVLPQITVSFSKPVTGVSADDLTVNGSPATALSGVAGTQGPYIFSGYADPGDGLVSVSLTSGGIQDSQSQSFAGDNWNYALEARLVINEFMASNNTSVQDPAGDFDDWIEVYNPGSTAVDMGGMFLTDNIGFPQQFQIPAGVTIGPHSYLIFWCDGETGEGPTHTNFNLARTGEDIALFDNPGSGFALLDSVIYSTQTTDVSSGRFPDGTTGFIAMSLPTPGATNTISCTNNVDCTDLTDSCNTGVCTANECVAQPMANGTGCSDGVACTTGDICTAGVCGGTDNCPVGQTCNLLTGQCGSSPGGPVTKTFQQGVSGYSGTVDTFLNAANTTQNNAATTPIIVDAPGLATDARHALLRFDGIFGNGASQIPLGSTISSATLKLNITNASLTGGTFHRMLQSWAATDTWDSRVNGLQADGIEAVLTADATDASGIELRSISVTSSLAAWSAGATNLGWAILPGGDDSWQWHSAEGTVPPSLEVTYIGTSSCSGPGDCNDGNLCTQDLCTAGVCSNPPVTCPVGQSCNSGNGLCEAQPVTVTFRQNVGGYTGEVDTFLNAGAATANNSATDPLIVDLAPSVNQVLMRFDSIFGSSAGQIPPNSTIQSATLTIFVTNGSTVGANLHRMAQSWNATDNWNTFATGGNGIQAGTECLASPDVTSFVNSINVSHTITVTNSVAAWAAAPATNFGWAWLPPATDDSWQFNSAENATAANRPLLSVTYLPGCGSAADCNDGNACTTDACVSNACVNTPIANCCLTVANCEDSNICTTDACSANVCTHTNNTVSCNDNSACTTTDTCSGGSCVGGPPPNCDDGNVCTTDSCVPATGCQHANNTSSCNDGVACTSGDVCASGVCAGTNNCPVGQTCNLSSGLCQAGSTTLTFREGLSGYSGTLDTYVQSAAPTVDNGAVDSIRWDSSDGTPAGPNYLLVQFTSIFGNGVNQIPLGSSITSATLSYTVGGDTNAPGDAGDLRESLVAWTESTTFNTYGGDAGVQSDEYGVVSIATTPGTPVGTYTVTVTSSLAAWSANPSSNNGWIVIPTNTNGVQVRSSEFVATPTERPTLTVTFSGSGSACTTVADCNDLNPCTDDACVANVCQHTNNTVSCNDNNACTTTDACSGGSCLGSGALNCDDSNVCTTDSCVPATGCTHTNNTVSCNDGVACTTSDVCAGGVCAGTSNCPVGQTCNLSSGSCEGGGSTTLIFQNGLNGYSDSQDTYIDTALASQASVSPIVIDGSPVEQVLIRFDGIFGSGPSQIPPGSAISSATLTLWVGTGANDQSANAVEFHQLLHAWVDTGVWADYGVSPWNTQGGIQADGTDALASAEATATMSTAGLSYPVTVTASLQAWAANPASNYGWVILPTGTDGLRLVSEDGAVAANRPMLTVTFASAGQPCTTVADCDDGNVCTTDACVSSQCQHTNNALSCDDSNVCTTSDVCSGGSCVGGPTLNCDDGNVCTTDSCVPASGCQHANNTVSCNDGVTCTSGDVCSAGTCSGTSNCPVGQTCNLSNGLCESPPSPMQMNCQLIDSTVAPGGTTRVDVFLTNSGTAPSVRGYQTRIGINRTSGTGTLDVPCPCPCPPASHDDGGVEVDSGRSDYLFFGVSSLFSSVNCVDLAAATSRLSGATAVGPVPEYLASYTVDVSADAAIGSTFAISVLPSNASLLSDSGGQPIPFGVGPSCVLTVGTTSAPVVEIELVALSLASASDVAATLPTPTSLVRQGSAFVVEVWAQTTQPSGFGSVSADVTYNSARTSATTVTHTALFSTFPSGTIDNPGGRINDLSGSHPLAVPACSDLVGVQPQWGRVAIIQLLASSLGSSAFASSVTGNPIYGTSICGVLGDVNPTDISFGSTAVTVVQCLTASDCNDGNGCTTDACVANVCQNTNNTLACNDNNACTTADACSGGVCVGGPALSCNDSNVCTTDTCNPASGCVNTNNTNPCTDGSACTVGDTCSGGACVPGAAPNCNDGNVCTTDSCNPATGCVNANNTNSCSDGNACTTPDVCSGGVCTAGPALNCNDNNVCTNDSCNTVTGCVFTNNTGPCTDNNACTTPDVCSGGACVGGPAVNCNDSNVCTADSCSPATGCVNNGTGVTSPCNDGNSCTNGDVCQGNAAGTCQGTPIPSCTNCTINADCSDSNVCTGLETCQVGICTPGTPLNCNDSNLCTTDSCHPITGCSNVFNSLPCDDGNACTSGDLCAGGACVGGGPTNCDDTNGCTTDSCVAPTGCLNNPVANGTDCDDGLFCNGESFCVDGVCETDPAPCADDCESCDEGTDSCEWCVLDLNQNGVMDGLDFGFFSGCFGACFLPSDPCAVSNFDGDLGICVGATDFGAFSGCFGQTCGGCTNCTPVSAVTAAGLSDPFGVEVRLVPVSISGGDDEVEALPVPLHAVRVGDEFQAELWARVRSGSADASLAAVFVNAHISSENLQVERYIASDLFETLSGAELEEVDVVRSMGGCAPLGDGSVGVTSAWVRVGALMLRATHPGSASISPSPADQPYGLAAFGRFDGIDPSLVEYVPATLRILGEGGPKSTTPARVGPPNR